MTELVLDAETQAIVDALQNTYEARNKNGSQTFEWRAAQTIMRQHAQIMAAIALSYEGHSGSGRGCACVSCRIRHVLRGHTLEPDPVTIMRDELKRLKDKT